jgi:hypothetical protein
MYFFYVFQRFAKWGRRSKSKEIEAGYQKLLEDPVEGPRQDNPPKPPRPMTPAEELEERNAWLRVVSFLPSFHITDIYVSQN